MIDPTATKLSVRKIQDKGKMSEVELLIKVWVPTSQLIETAQNISLPMWVIQKALK